LDAAAVQWAIWEVAVEGSSTGSLTTGSVRVADSPVAAFANSYLSNVNSYTPVNLTYLTNGTRQDVVTWNMVPEPGVADSPRTSRPRVVPSSALNKGCVISAPDIVSGADVLFLALGPEIRRITPDSAYFPEMPDEVFLHDRSSRQVCCFHPDAPRSRDGCRAES